MVLPGIPSLHASMTRLRRWIEICTRQCSIKSSSSTSSTFHPALPGRSDQITPLSTRVLDGMYYRRRYQRSGFGRKNTRARRKVCINAWVTLLGQGADDAGQPGEMEAWHPVVVAIRKVSRCRGDDEGTGCPMHLDWLSIYHPGWPRRLGARVLRGMGSVYRHSYLTIAATSATDGNGGCPRNSNSGPDELKIPASWKWRVYCLRLQAFSARPLELPIAAAASVDVPRAIFCHRGCSSLPNPRSFGNANYALWLRVRLAPQRRCLESRARKWQRRWIRCLSRHWRYRTAAPFASDWEELAQRW